MFDAIQAISCKGHTFTGAELTRPFFLSKRELNISMTSIDAIAEISFTKYDAIISMRDMKFHFIVNGKPVDGIWYRLKTNELEIHIHDIEDHYKGSWHIRITRSQMLTNLIMLCKGFGCSLVLWWFIELITTRSVTHPERDAISKKINSKTEFKTRSDTTNLEISRISRWDGKGAVLIYRNGSKYGIVTFKCSELKNNQIQITILNSQKIDNKRGQSKSGKKK